MKIGFFLVLMISLLAINNNAQNTNEPMNAKDQSMLATRECISKGGIGIIKRGLYVVVASENNEIDIGSPKRWQGRTKDVAEVVFFFRGRIWTAQELPDDFDISDSVLISFERQVIRFINFSNMVGGYYRRVSPA